MKRTPIGSAGAATTKQPSPRARRPSQERQGVSPSLGGGSAAFAASSGSGGQHLRSAGASSAFGPVRRNEFETDEEKAPTDRDFAFLQAKTHHSRGGSDSEFDNMLQLVPGLSRGTSPHTVTQSSLTRPIRPTMRQSLAQPPPPNETPLVATSITPEPPSVNSRPSSPATVRPQSPTTNITVRQPTSPQLLAMRAQSPTTTVTGSSLHRPQSPPQIAAGSAMARPRSQSLDSKGVLVQPLPARAAGPGSRPMPSATASAYVSGPVQPVVGSSPVGAKAVPKPLTLTTVRTGTSPTPISQVPSALLKQPMSQPQMPAAQATAQQSVAPLAKLPTGPLQAASGASSSPASALNQLSPDLLSALAAGDSNLLTEDQFDYLERYIAFMREKKKGTTAPQSQLHSDAANRRTRPDSLEEVYWQGYEDQHSYQQRQRGGSQDAGRQAPNMKMFESQVPGEETRGTAERKPSSPNPWYLNPVHPPVRDESYIKTQPRIPPNAMSFTLEPAVPDLTRSVDIVSGTSAFTLSPTSYHDSEDEVKHEDPTIA